MSVAGLRLNIAAGVPALPVIRQFTQLKPPIPVTVLSEYRKPFTLSMLQLVKLKYSFCETVELVNPMAYGSPPDGPINRQLVAWMLLVMPVIWIRKVGTIEPPSPLKPNSTSFMNNSAMSFSQICELIDQPKQTLSRARPTPMPSVFMPNACL